ncbi:MAG: prephenate dehydrogenase/arogenate dehydrogenase family protein [Lachnospiraceae bacterium]|nr:prephenate dehydrogenase/arogenate dehydrogenase family protein [Lachnospiraceae bacterium]
MQTESMKISILGLGLIGGSIARSIKACDSSVYIYAVSGHMENIDSAVLDGVIDAGGRGLSENLRGSDVIFLTAPVEINIKYLRSLRPYLDEDTVVTDGGSVKSPIMKEAKTLGLSGCFIGGHPMAGSEKSGYKSSRADLLKDARYILTPFENTDQTKLTKIKDIVTMTGAKALVMDAEKHDRLTAAVSHIPHIVSASLVNLVKHSDDRDGLAKEIAAGGFRDITRISSSDPEMWRQICMENRESISFLMRGYIDSLNRILDMLENSDEDALKSMFSDAKRYRDEI